MNLSSDEIAVFLAVMDSGSFAAAARRLGRVPSAVSMTIGMLEAQLDLLLFDRSGREVKPTEHALSLEPMARQLIMQLRQIGLHALSLNEGLERRLTLAVSPEILDASWSRPLATLGREYPGLEVVILAAAQDDARKLLHDGVAQLILAHENSIVDAKESIQVVGRESFICVISPKHEFVQQNGCLRAKDIFDLRQIVVASRTNDSVDPRFMVSRQQWRVDNFTTALHMVCSGAGWAYLPRALVRPLIDSGSLLEVAFDNFTNQVWLWINVVWMKDRSLGLGARRYVELMLGNSKPVK